MSKYIKFKENGLALLNSIINSVIFAVIASLLTTHIVTQFQDKAYINEQLKNVSNIYIGCNKQWADDKFGTPQFSGKSEQYTLCAYITDFFVVQMIFDDALSARAYSITALNNRENISLKIEDKTLFPDNCYTLGEFSYYDFPGRPECVFGAISNGNARATYYEEYYFISKGNYYNYYIGFLDYGKTNGTFQDEIYKFSIVDGDIDDEVTAEKNHGVQIIEDRRNAFPNTYAVSTLDDNITDMIFSYNWFNSQQLRNTLNTR